MVSSSWLVVADLPWKATPSRVANQRGSGGCGERPPVKPEHAVIVTPDRLGLLKSTSSIWCSVGRPDQLVVLRQPVVDQYHVVLTVEQSSAVLAQDDVGDIGAHLTGTPERNGPAVPRRGVQPVTREQVGGERVMGEDRQLICLSDGPSDHTDGSDAVVIARL